MSSKFKKIYIYIAGFLIQWAFHRVKDHPNRSSDEGVMTFRIWKSYSVKS